MSGDNNTERTCGTCVACCVYLSIHENGFNKSALKPCPKLVDWEDLVPPVHDGGGDDGRAFQGMPLFESKHFRGPDHNNCTIVDSRPSVCKGYKCAWLLGYGQDKDRPDRSGVIVDDVSQQGPIGNALIAKPLWFGADEEQAGGTAIKNISRDSNKPLLVLQFSEFKLLRIVGRGV